MVSLWQHDFLVIEIMLTAAGTQTASAWVRCGHRTLDDLRAVETSLTRCQRIGLKYYDELLDRMPRTEAAEIEATVLWSILSSYQLSVKNFCIVFTCTFVHCCCVCSFFIFLMIFSHVITFASWLVGWFVHWLFHFQIRPKPNLAEFRNSNSAEAEAEAEFGWNLFSSHRTIRQW